MLHDDWLERIYRLRHFSEPIEPRGQATHERLNERLIVDDTRFNLLDVPDRNLNYRFAVAEWVWMSFGHSDVATIARYNSVMRRFSDDGVFLTGAYGPHINAQRFRVLRKLKEDPMTRQAVIEIPRPRLYATKDEPCTLSLQFLQRHGALHLIATMRSSDAWLGIPYDVFTFTQFQNVFAGELGVARGWFALNMGSSHLYQRDFEAADKVLHSRQQPMTIRTADLPGPPPAWLNDVLLTQDANAIPPTTSDAEPWLPYARVLLTRTSAEARDILLAAGR